jgi:protein farnesyltransferase/geranylgeranyltransferase type-1 subunit alpha
MVLLKKDQKNYHAWSYRVWLTEHAQIHKEEINFAFRMIKKDAYNNSAWSHLYFALEGTLKYEDESSRKELVEVYIDFTLQNLKAHKGNKASWNFLRGLFPSIKLKNIPAQNSFKKSLATSFEEYPQIYAYCEA